MPYFLGIDTSNYTTSASVYDSDTGTMRMQKKLLPVRQGSCGLRQSDAVFHHVQQLPEVMEALWQDFDGEITAVGVSSRPRNIEGSYMPCFTVGMTAARVIAQVNHIPVYAFAHQDGHIAAAIFSTGQNRLLKQPFLAFHVSGGTTEALLVQPDAEKILDVSLAAKTLDLNAGQLIDRVGVMLGLGFPCGMELEGLAAENDEKLSGIRPTLKGADCCLSGVENICRTAFESGRSKAYVAALCLAYVEKTVSRMCSLLLETYGNLPVLFAGGVMSDRLIRVQLEKQFDAYFAEPAYSADNASGTAYLCSLRHNNKR